MQFNLIRSDTRYHDTRDTGAAYGGQAANLDKTGYFGRNFAINGEPGHKEKNTVLQGLGYGGNRYNKIECNEKGVDGPFNYHIIIF